MYCCTLFLVSSLTLPFPEIARETVVFETPRYSATSAIVSFFSTGSTVFLTFLLHNCATCAQSVAHHIYIITAFFCFVNRLFCTIRLLKRLLLQVFCADLSKSASKRFLFVAQTQILSYNKYKYICCHPQSQKGGHLWKPSV